MNDDGVPLTFEEAAGQWMKVRRPPEGYVVIATPRGGSAVISEDFLRDPVSGPLILRNLEVEPRFGRGGG